jgi:hypothetical protein
MRNRSSDSSRRKAANEPTSKSFVNAAGLREAHQSVRSAESPMLLNRKGMVTQRLRRLPAGVVHNMHSHVWNSRKKNRSGDCNPRYRVEIDLRHLGEQIARVTVQRLRL